MEYILVFIKNVISQVNVITGGNHWLATAIFAGLAWAGRSIPIRIYHTFIHLITVTLRVVDTSPEHTSTTIDNILIYLKKNMSPSLQRNFSVNEYADTLDKRIMTGLGFHFVKILNTWVLIELKSNQIDTGEVRKLIVKTMFWNRNKFNGIISEFYPIDYSIPFIYSFQGEDWLRDIGSIPKLYSTEKQLIDDDLYDKINSIVDRFVNDDEYYKKYKLTRKESFLLHGPPGTGKSNLIRHLASKYNLPVVIVKKYNLHRVVKSSSVKTMGKIIILLEDLKFTSKELNSVKKQSSDSIDFEESLDISDLLNAMDGINPLQNVLLFVTSNYIDTIPPEFYRPGRIKHLIYFGYPNKETVLKTIGFNKEDDRYKYLNTLDLKDIPIDNIVSIRNSETVTDVIKIIETKDDYLKLSLNK